MRSSYLAVLGGFVLTGWDISKLHLLLLSLFLPPTQTNMKGRNWVSLILVTTYKSETLCRSSCQISTFSNISLTSIWSLHITDQTRPTSSNVATDLMVVRWLNLPQILWWYRDSEIFWIEQYESICLSFSNLTEQFSYNVTLKQKRYDFLIKVVSKNITKRRTFLQIVTDWLRKDRMELLYVTKKRS